MTKMSGLLVLTIILALSQACANCVPCYQPHVYDGPIRSEREVAILYGRFGLPAGVTINVQSVDGVNIRQKSGIAPVKVYLEPGSHSIKLGVQFTNHSDFPEITYSFEAGRRYQVFYKLLGKDERNNIDYKYWVEDMGESYTPPKHIFSEPEKGKVVVH